MFSSQEICYPQCFTFLGLCSTTRWQNVRRAACDTQRNFERIQRNLKLRKENWSKWYIYQGFTYYFPTPFLLSVGSLRGRGWLAKKIFRGEGLACPFSGPKIGAVICPKFSKTVPPVPNFWGFAPKILPPISDYWGGGKKCRLVNIGGGQAPHSQGLRF